MRKQKDQRADATRCVHSGEERHGQAAPLTTPIAQTAVFVVPGVEGLRHAALDELPEEQREVFVAHELEGRSFNELAAATGLGVNTLLSRKHYAVLHLRRRLQVIYDEFKRL